MGFFEDDDGVNSQFQQRRIDGTDILTRRPKTTSQVEEDNQNRDDNLQNNIRRD